RNRCNLDARLTLSRSFYFQSSQARCHIYAQIGRGNSFQRLFLGFHDVRQRRVARLVQAQVCSYNCWQVQSNSDQTTVYLTGNIDLFTLDHNLRCEGSLRITAQGCQHLTSLVVVGVNRSEEHTSELQSRENLVCRLLL